MVKPGGTGSCSTEVISARLAPLPPRRSLSSMGGRPCVWSKSKTNGIGPPCPGRTSRVASALTRDGALPTWDGPPQPTFLPVLLRIGSALRATTRTAVGGLGVTRDRSYDVSLEDLFCLAHEVAHDCQFVGLEALGHLAHLLGDGLL